MSGTYTFDAEPQHSTLILYRSELFEQELRTRGHIERAHGRWRRVGEGGVVFSKDFLTLVGQEASPDGQVDAEVRKGFGGLFVSMMAFEPEPEGPVFHKRWFR